MKFSKRAVFLLAVITLYGCQKPPPAEDCLSSANANCRTIGEAQERIYLDQMKRDSQADVAAERTRINEAAAADNSAQSGYENMTRGLPVIK